jgi:hypothetical protein
VKVKTPCAVIGCALVDEGGGTWWWFAEERRNFLEALKYIQSTRRKKDTWSAQPCGAETSPVFAHFQLQHINPV